MYIYVRVDKRKCGHVLRNRFVGYCGIPVAIGYSVKDEINSPIIPRPYTTSIYITACNENNLRRQ